MAMRTPAPHITSGAVQRGCVKRVIFRPFWSRWMHFAKPKSPIFTCRIHHGNGMQRPEQVWVRGQAVNCPVTVPNSHAAPQLQESLLCRLTGCRCCMVTCSCCWSTPVQLATTSGPAHLAICANEQVGAAQVSMCNAASMQVTHACGSIMQHLQAPLPCQVGQHPAALHSMRTARQHCWWQTAAAAQLAQL